MIDDLNLSSMTPAEAREYVLAFVTTLRQTVRERARLSEQLELWRKRLVLARGKGDAELVDAADARVTEVAEQLRMIGDDERELEIKVERLKNELRHVESSGSRLVDAESLLEQLQSVVGEPDTTSEKIRDLEAQTELDELKRKVQDSDARGDK